MYMQTYYRIIDLDTGEILADCPEQDQAFETLVLLELDHPDSRLEIEPYTHNHVKPGFGRDPDLH
ncbi:MAG: hypothetical protein VW551_07935 [Euryarchaeota archaeon]|jgi:hypothetical protein